MSSMTEAKRVLKDQLRSIETELEVLERKRKALRQALTAVNGVSVTNAGKKVGKRRRRVASKTRQNRAARKMQILDILKLEQNTTFEPKMFVQRGIPYQSAKNAMLELIQEKKVQHVGLSTTGQPQIQYKPTQIHAGIGALP